jgi:16S rRNA (guanine1207-N2)-methyltransferase
MNHYFSESSETLKSNPKKIAFRVKNTPLEFVTDHGVFSKDSLDRGTEVLLEYLTIKDTDQEILDLGCGYGVVGIYINKAYGVHVDMVDINERALDLAKQNVILNQANCDVFKSDGCDNLSKTYDCIITNPPIRAGKEIVYRFFTDAHKYLTENGVLFVVINKKHGADSAFRKLESIYSSVTLVGRQKGFHVYKCEKSLTI